MEAVEARARELLIKARAELLRMYEMFPVPEDGSDSDAAVEINRNVFCARVRVLLEVLDELGADEIPPEYYGTTDPYVAHQRHKRAVQGVERRYGRW